jgi:hypothetical protein
MSNAPSNQERLLELLADQALNGISSADLAELRALLAQSKLDPATLERVAARIAVALNPQPWEPLPEELHQRIKAAAKALPQFGGPAATTAIKKNSPPTAQLPLTPAGQPPKHSRRETLAWIIAAASFLGLSATLIYPLFKPDSSPVPLLSRIEQDRSAIRVAWTGTDDAAGRGSKGEIIWSNSIQAGLLKVTGLAKNDAAKSQYQLWIFDANQDDRYPIDGGVFDIEKDGTVTIPIKAAIRVTNPAMFAVTVEKPGGVVVSARERVVLLAKNEASKPQ